MKAQEALEIITNAIQTDGMTVEQDKALALAQKAFEKQIPKNIIFGYDEQDDICCSNCGPGIAIMDSYEYEKHTYKYCFNCGQALDWSDTNE